MSQIKRIRGNQRFPVSPENKKDFHEISKHAQKCPTFLTHLDQSFNKDKDDGESLYGILIGLRLGRI